MTPENKKVAKNLATEIGARALPAASVGLFAGASELPKMHFGGSEGLLREATSRVLPAVTDFAATHPYQTLAATTAAAIIPAIVKGVQAHRKWVVERQNNPDLMNKNLFRK